MNESWIIEGRGKITSAKSIKCDVSNMSTKSTNSNTSKKSTESERSSANSTVSIGSMGSSICNEETVASSSAPVVWFDKSISVFASKFRRSLRFAKLHHRQSEVEDGARHSYRKSPNSRMGMDDVEDKEWQYYW